MEIQAEQMKIDEARPSDGVLKQTVDERGSQAGQLSVSMLGERVRVERDPGDRRVEQLSTAGQQKVVDQRLDLVPLPSHRRHIVSKKIL